MFKRFIVISLLLLLTSACNADVTVLTPAPEQVQSSQSVPSNTAESIPPIATTSPDLAATEAALPRPTFVDPATASSACPGAAAPRVAVGQFVSVVASDSDKLKLRSEPEISADTVLMELNKFTRLKIVGGFLCVHSDETETSYWFWQVMVIPTGEIGWVSEGDASQYFIERTFGQPLSTVEATCFGAPVPHVAIGQEVMVVVVDTDKLKLRSEPKISPDTMLMELDKFTYLKILEGPVCVSSEETQTSYWFWKVRVLSNGNTGWVAEGDVQNYFIE